MKVYFVGIEGQPSPAGLEACKDEDAAWVRSESISSLSIGKNRGIVYVGELSRVGYAQVVITEKIERVFLDKAD